MKTVSKVFAGAIALTALAWTTMVQAAPLQTGDTVVFGFTPAVTPANADSTTLTSFSAGPLSVTSTFSFSPPGGLGFLAGGTGSLNGGAAITLPACSPQCTVLVPPANYTAANFVALTNGPNNMTFTPLSLQITRNTLGSGGNVAIFSALGTVCVDTFTPDQCRPGRFNVTLSYTPGVTFLGATGQVTVVPEPPTLALLGAALLGFGFLWFRRSKVA